MGKGRFRSKMEGINMRKPVYMCLNCRNQTDTKPTTSCCDKPEVQYFMSRAEVVRGAELLLLRDYGRITKLKFQPRFDLKVNGVKVTTYIADAQYYEGDNLVVEDTKPEGFMTDLAKLKIKLFEAVHAGQGIKVRLPRR